jgi:hypothetical protein
MRYHIGHDEQQREKGGRTENQLRIKLRPDRHQWMAL